MGYSCICDMCGATIKVDNSEVAMCYPVGDGPPPFKITFPKWADEHRAPEYHGPDPYSRYMTQGPTTLPQADCLCTECTTWLKKIVDFAKQYGTRYVRYTAPQDMKNEGGPV